VNENSQAPTPAHKGFVVTLVLGSIAFLTQLIKFLDPIERNELWEGTAITASCYGLALIGLVFVLVNFRKNRIRLDQYDRRSVVFAVAHDSL